MNINNQPPPATPALRLALLVLKGINQLPFSWQLRIGDILGTLMFYGMKRRRHIAATNIRICFPDHTEQDQHRTLKAHFRYLGRTIIEMGLSWWGKRAQLTPLTHIEGLEHLTHAIDQKRGVILLSGHFTNLEMGGWLLRHHLPFSVMQRRDQKTHMGHIIDQGRQQNFTRVISHDDIRGMLKALKAGEVVWYAPDQNYRGKGSLDIPFFGSPAATNNATARIAKISQSPVVPFFAHATRDEQGREGYTLTILPPLKDFPSNDAYQDALLINQLIEQEIIQYPAQYLWVHRRFKRRRDEKDNTYNRPNSASKP